jgi:hypothetical protein
MIVHAHFKQKNGDDPTIDWLMARVGVVTASEFDNLITPKGKIKTGEGPKTYLHRKLAETWQGAPLDAFQSFAMGQGSLLESEALPYLQTRYDLDVQTVGLVTTDDGRAGCSPDGLIFNADFKKDGPTQLKECPIWSGVEIKAPELPTQIKYLLAGCCPDDYYAQVQGCMMVTGCSSWHFLSYRRRMPAFHLIVHRDEEFITNLTEALAEFYVNFDAALAHLTEINGGPPDNKHRGNVPFPKREQTSAEMVDYKV